MSTKRPKGKAVAAPVALKKALNRAWWDADAKPVITSKTKVTICQPAPYVLRSNTYSDF